MKYKFKSGALVEGSADQILEMAKALGEILDLSKVEGEVPRGKYLSEKNGLMDIKDMSDWHLRNALLKKSKSFYEKLSATHKVLSNADFCKSYVTLTDDQAVQDLFTELSKRKDKPKI